MLMGFAVDAQEPIDGILPYTDIEGIDGVLLGRLWEFVEFVDKAQRSVREEKTLNQWSETLYSFCSSLFDERELPELYEIYAIIAPLAERFGACHQEPVSFGVVRSWVEHQAEMKLSAGFLRGRLTFCSMLPMRSIPFRCICLLGLQEGAFPKVDNFAPFDILGWNYRHGDRSRRSDDRYQALEAILAARDHLYLSYVGQSAKNNDKLCGSVVVTELLETLDNYYDIPDCTVRHPLQPSSQRYFSGDSDLFSYDTYQCRVASALGEQNDVLSGPWLSSPVNNRVPTQLGCTDLEAFLMQPQNYFMRHVMGLHPGWGDTYPQEHELFELDNLQKFLASQVLADGLLDGRDPRHILNSLQNAQTYPLAAPGTALFEKEQALVVSLVDTIQKKKLGKSQPELPVDIEIAGNFLTGVLVNRYEGGLLFYRCGSLKGKDILRGWLYHLLAREVLEDSLPTHVITTDQSLSIPPGYGDRNELSFLIRLFMDGYRHPSKLHVEPAWAYVQQVIANRGRGRRKPIQAAYAQFENDLTNGYLPQSTLLYRGRSVEEILDDEFETLCIDFLLPLWEVIVSGANGGSGE